ncbi:MAG: hypothetical protein JF591_22940, partial [Lysobacter sp.]|nr:hypothetical protein [Lysobacter sp.]
MRLLAVLSLVSALGACASGPAVRAPAAKLDAAAGAREVRRLADEYVAAYREHDPISYFLDGLSLEHHDRLSDNRLSELAAWQRKEDGWAQALAAVDADALWGTPEWVLRGMLAFRLESSRRVRVCRYELWSVAQIHGWLDDLAETA